MSFLRISNTRFRYTPLTKEENERINKEIYPQKEKPSIQDLLWLGEWCVRSARLAIKHVHNQDVFNIKKSLLLSLARIYYSKLFTKYEPKNFNRVKEIKNLNIDPSIQLLDKKIKLHDQNLTVNELLGFLEEKDNELAVKEDEIINKNLLNYDEMQLFYRECQAFIGQKFETGQCGEFCSIVINLLLECPFFKNKKTDHLIVEQIDFPKIDINNSYNITDHTLIIIKSKNSLSWYEDPDTVVVDPWANACFILGQERKKPPEEQHPIMKIINTTKSSVELTFRIGQGHTRQWKNECKNRRPLNLLTHLSSKSTCKKRKIETINYEESENKKRRRLLKPDMNKKSNKSSKI